MADSAIDPRTAATLAASFVRDFRARGLLHPATARRVFLAFLIARARGASAPDASSVCALVVAVGKRIGATSASAGHCGLSPADVAEHSECVAAALPVPAEYTESALDTEYKKLLASGAVSADLRGALGDGDAELVQSPLTPERSPLKRAAPTAVPRTPPKRPRSDNAGDASTSPQTPARADAPPTPHTPTRTPRTPARTSARTTADLGSFAKFVLDSPVPITPARLHRSDVNALDALAAVASNTPRSTAMKSQSLPHTPVSTSVALAAWLKRLSQMRSEDIEGSSRSTELKSLVTDDDWARIISRFARLLGCYTAVGTGIKLGGHQQDVVSVYSSTLEAILMREKKRGGEIGGVVFVNKLVRSDNFHACLLSCALETVAAVHGLRDMATINAALKAFDLSAYELTKAISSFARQLPECPRIIAKHLITCEQRYVESVVWKQGSDLVKYLAERSTRSSASSSLSGTATANHTCSTATATATTGGRVDNWTRQIDKSDDAVSERKERVEENAVLESNSDSKGKAKEVQKTPETEQNEKLKIVSKPKSSPSLTKMPLVPSRSEVPERLSVKDLTLQLFYKKLLYIAQERMLELLSVLQLHFLAEPVFAIIKYAVWEKWYLLVDRHLDQIILCSIYGVAKVSKLSISFRAIVDQYQNVSHLSDPTFQPLLPAVFREIPLKYNAPVAPHLPPRQANDSLVKGDIIKMYNTLFMPTMKHLLLQLSSRRKDNMCVGVHSTGTIRANSEFATLSGSISVGRMDKSDPVSMSVLQSPLRTRGHHSSPRRIGNVTVSPMSPRVRQLVSLHQSPGNRIERSPAHTTMTPNTRTLYAFGESPVRPQGAVGRHAPVPLSFNRSGERTASIRRMYAERSADANRRRQSE